MIIPVKKYLFLGTKEDLNHFFDAAQQKGMIQFIPAITTEIPKSREIDELAHALKILKHYPVQEFIYPEGYSASEIVSSILHLQEELHQYEELRLEIQTEIFKVQPFGDFSLETLQEIEKNSACRFYFYFAKRSATFDHEELILVNTDHEFDFYMAFTQKPYDLKELTLVEIKESLSSLKNRLNEVEEGIKKIEANLKNFAPFSDYLRNILLEKTSEYELHVAKNGVASELDDRLFVVHAWVPENKSSDLVHLTFNTSVHFEEIRVEPQDRVPTCMENKGLAKVGEDLVHIYDVPSNEDKDPSLWVLFSFSLFFSMIISDAAYGFIYLLFGLFLFFKNPNAQGALKRVITLINIVASFSILWGVFTCSYFSIPIKPDSVLYKISGVNYLVRQKASYHIQQKDEDYQEFVKEFPAIKDKKDPKEFIFSAVKNVDGHMSYPIQEGFADSIMIELAFVVGIIHLSLSMLRNIRGSWAGIGWIFTMIGGYLYVPIFLNVTSIVHFLGILSSTMAANVGYQLLIGGIGVAVFLSVCQNRLKGLAEILTSLQVFADVLSYVRLYALGLAGMMIASTFNALGQDLGFVLGAFVTLIGHLTNFTLGIMGGVIHGLRLNFLEWYHYSFQGGGRLFSPLRLLKEKLQ
jgi:V/A-type H+-transporting ATPase subunit I